MTVRVHWIRRALGWLPNGMRQALDDWSAGLAARRAAERRAAAAQPKSAQGT